LIIPPIPSTPAIQNFDGSGNLVVTRAEIPPSSAFGSGYFLMPELPLNSKTSKINSGKALLSPTPILIVTQPTSLTINPAATATFTVAVNAAVQGSISYRWRKNGVTIENATASSYSITNVTNSNEGQYDCVITNDTFTIISNAATLTVNDPITTVTASRSPSATNIATGQNVTFTASPAGSGPFTYQWRKNGADIPTAVSQTYTISSAATTDTATYTVLVSNGLTTSGVVSNGVALNVIAPVTISAVSRTPSDASISAGTSVTFSVVTSTSGTLTYQWRKDGVPIPLATSATYTISVPTSADNGNYTVLVKNEVTSNGVSSSAVNLTVVDP
jgi:plastocyanin